MGMKYVASYLLCVSSGNTQPSVSDVKKVLDSVGIEYDTTIIETMISNMQGKLCHEVVASGLSKLQSVSTGAVASAGAVSGAAASGGADNSAQAASKKEEEEEEEGDLGFSLFD